MMARVAGLALVLLLWVTQSATQELHRTRVVNTTTGPVQGIIKYTHWYGVKCEVYYGIRYAEPPVGKRRFKPPVPIKPWTYVFNASEEGNACPQIDYFTYQYTGEEDCLVLNVYIPINPIDDDPPTFTEFGTVSNLKPVMVWIYGGAYMEGVSTRSMFGPDFFLEQGVIFVSLNYRLGVAGFLNLGHPDALGNAGLKDQNLALRWVRDNIANFGGDPNRVTIFGESAGSASVAYHVLSPKSTGLFSQAILESGTPLCQWAYHTPKKAYLNAKNLASKLGYRGNSTQELLDYLLQADIHSLVVETLRVDAGVLPFRPSIEDTSVATDGSEFLTDCPVNLYKSGNFNKVPTIMGYNKDETLYFTSALLANNSHTKQLSSFLSRSAGLNGLPNKILSYFGEAALDFTPNVFSEEFVRFSTDIFFVAPIDLTQRLLADQNEGNPIYYYRLSYESAYTMHSEEGDSINGTAHVDDIDYLFNVDMLHQPKDPNNPFNVFRRKFVRLWTNFAKYGNPTPLIGIGDQFDVIWEESNLFGVQLDINTTPVLLPRLIDSTASSYQRGFLSRLPAETACTSTM